MPRERETMSSSFQSPQARRRLAAAVLAALFWTMAPSLLPAETTDYERLLGEVDTLATFESSDFSAVMTMVTRDPAEGTDKLVVTQFRRDAEEKFVLLILEPATRKGQGYLRIDDNLWIYDPESRKFTHSSMKENFEGTNAKNSDFRHSSLAADYRVAGHDEGRLGAYDVYILELEAKTGGVSYPYARIWIRKDIHLLLKMEEYSLNKRLMRTSLFPRYARVGDKLIPSLIIFRDELVKGRETRITFQDISTDPLPDKVFTKAYIEQVNR